MESWPISRVRPYPKNARKLSDKAVGKLAASIKEFGFRQPIVVDKKGIIIAGHTRLLAAQSLELAEVPVHVAANLTPAQVRQYRLADNRTAQETSWDLDLLSAELLELQALDLDLSLTGFDADELKMFMADPTEGLTDPDDCPAPQAEAISAAGDLWILGSHRLLCGDCRDFSATERLFDGARINLAFTSPPYAEQREYDASSGFRPIPPDEYVEWYRDVAAGILPNLAPDGSYFLNIKPSCDELDTDLYVMDLVLAHVREWGWHFATEFCWERNGVPKSVTQRFKNQFEPIYQFVLGRWKMRPDDVRHASQNVPRAGGAGSGQASWAKQQGGKGAASVSGSFGAAKKRRNGTASLISDVQGVAHDAGEYIGPGMAYPGNRLPTFAGTHQAKGHAASFPVGLAEFFVKAYTDIGDTVYDPFMGSGSTLMAAHQNERRGYGMELSPSYCDVIVRRLQEFTGKQATLEGDGRTFDQLAECRQSQSAAA